MKILETNVVMSCMILVILLFRIVGRTRLSKTMVVHLWNVVLLRALIPMERIVIRVPFVRRGMEYLSPSNGQPDIPGLLQRSRELF